MRRLRNDEGFSLVLVAVLLMVLLAFAGFAVDVGAMYQERRELRNGADAAALAVAQACAENPAAADCSDERDDDSPAQVYADLNADDDNSGVDSVEIDVSPQNPLYDFTVGVVTSSEDDTGNPGLSLSFMRIFGKESAMVRGSAVAAVGPLAPTGRLPLVISDCEWNRVLDGTWAVGEEIVLYFHEGTGHQNESDCNNQAGQDLPGGFGWLDSDSACLATLLGGWASAEPGNSPPCGEGRIAELLTGPDGLGATVFVPYYDELRAPPSQTCPSGLSGQSKCYHLVGLGAFHVTGYHLKSGNKYIWNSPCGKGNTVCLGGHFETNVAVPEGEFGGEYRGVRLVRLID